MTSTLASLRPWIRLSPALTAALALAACGDNDRPDRLHLVSSTTQLVQYDSCGALERDLKQMLKDEVDAEIDGIGNGRGGPAEDGGGAPSPQAPGREEGVDYSGTNNQEDGVDEADLVKTDGYHVYVLNGNRLHIFGVPVFGQLTPESVTPIEGYPTEMLIDRDAGKAAVFSYIDVYSLPEDHPLRRAVGYGADDGGWWWRIGSVTKITVLDVSDRRHPSLVRELFFEGQYQTARKVDASVRMAAYSWLNFSVLWGWWTYWNESNGDVEYTRRRAHEDIDALALHDLIPALYVRTPDGELTTNSLSSDSCRSYYRPTDSHAHGVSTILSFDLFGSALHVDADHVISNWATFYASTDTLVLTEAAHDWWWYWDWEDDPEHLNVHAFDISHPGETHYLGSGRVQGWLFDQFSIDEEDGHIRLATTTNMWRRWWVENPPPAENHVWVLERQGHELATVGHLGGIARGETITTARMMGDKGFLVTFERRDPLWTLDLSDPRDPRLVGKLEVPGFSTYLHPMAGDHLLSIGVGGDENGANWKTTVSLFDVGNFAHPSLTASLPLAMDDGWGWSEALWEHKAFTYWPPEKLLAVPQSSYRAVATPEGYPEYQYLSRLELVTVDPETGLAHKGAIDHSGYYNSDPDQYWNYVDIRRSIFMGDYVYAISDRAVTVHRTADLTQITAQELPGWLPGQYWWWW